MENKLEKAFVIAQAYDVSTEPNNAIVYSVSYMPTDKNKKDAEKFAREHPKARMLDDTPCGKALISLGLDGKVNEVGEEITKIWRLASSRYIAAASGNITAFVEGADKRSTFCTTELAEILQNDKITHINGMKKEEFATTFATQYYK